MTPEPAAPDRLSANIAQLPADSSIPNPSSPNSIAILAAPDDTGVALNKGNPGARFGPAAFRAALASFSTQHDLLQPNAPLPNILDADDAFPNLLPDPSATPPHNEQTMLDSHDQVHARTFALQEAGYITTLIGGGNDFTLPAVTALCDASTESQVAGINVDPHLDMRERPGSGMPYRKLIEAGTINPNHFSTIALGRYTNNTDHLTFAQSHNVHLVSAQHMLEHAAADTINHAFDRLAQSPVSFLSIDIDSIDAAHAPGVSARNPAGLTPTLAGDLAERAGRTPSLRHFEIVELNPLRDDPPFDPSNPATAGRTARLVAYLFRRFVAGVAARSSNIQSPNI